MDNDGHIKTHIDHTKRHIDTDLETYGQIWTHKDTQRHTKRHT